MHSHNNVSLNQNLNRQPHFEWNELKPKRIEYQFLPIEWFLLRPWSQEFPHSLLDCLSKNREKAAWREVSSPRHEICMNIMSRVHVATSIFLHNQMLNLKNQIYFRFIQIQALFRAKRKVKKTS